MQARTRKTRWKINGFCPECRKPQEILITDRYLEAEKNKRYFELMDQNDKPAARCPDCGGFYDLFVIKPIW